MNASHFSHRGISLTKIFRALAKTLGDQASLLLASNNRTIRMEFVGKHPIDANSLPPRRQGSRAKDPSIMESIQLMFHGSMPYISIWTCDSLTKVSGALDRSKVLGDGTDQGPQTCRHW